MELTIPAVYFIIRKLHFSAQDIYIRILRTQCCSFHKQRRVTCELGIEHSHLNIT
jgi:hypothetical protein